MPLLPQDKLDEKLGFVVERLKEALAPTAIYFFGSYVYGTPRSDSDLDILVVVERSELTPHQRDALAYEAVGAIGVSKDIQVYTRQEFEERAALTVSFERTVKTKGKLVYAA